jgi:predicted transcriptional regulator
LGKISQCDPHLDTILELTRQGVGRHTIAERLGLPHAALSAYMIRRGIASGQGRGLHRVRIDRGEVRRLVEAEGLTQAQAADRLGCSLSAIERVAKRMRLQTARTGPRAGEDHPGWKDGRCLDKHGYVEIYAPLHPQARTTTGRVAEHRLVMELALGRYLLAAEVVDHLDNHPRHNWPDNLRVYATNADHLRATLTGREKATPRRSIPGAYGNSQKIGRCPGPDETLALCPPETRCAVERYILAHHPTREQSRLPMRELLRTGAVLDPFPQTSRGLGNDCLP